MKTARLIVMAILAMAVVQAYAQETKYATGDQDGTGTNVAHVTFGPKNGRQTISSLHAVTDKTDGAVKFYTRTGKYAVTGTNSPTVVVFANTATATGYTVTNSDIVVISYPNGTVDQRTVSSCNSTSATINAAMSDTYVSGVYIYDLTQSGQMLVGRAGTDVGTNDTLNVSGDVFSVPGDSPCYIQVNGTSNSLIQATSK